MLMPPTTQGSADTIPAYLQHITAFAFAVGTQRAGFTTLDLAPYIGSFRRAVGLLSEYCTRGEGRGEVEEKGGWGAEKGEGKGTQIQRKCRRQLTPGECLFDDYLLLPPYFLQVNAWESKCRRVKSSEWIPSCCHVLGLVATRPTRCLRSCCHV